jgi:hypothetical protein
MAGWQKMAEPQLSIRSARARDMAHRIARREGRTVANVVERALDLYAVASGERQSVQGFLAQVSGSLGDDVDALEAKLAANRAPHRGPTL